jgi:predicted GNAT superfamily acetyltransferase
MTDSQQGIQIRPLQNAQEYHTCEQIQLEIWEADPIEVAPAHLLITVERHGGLFLGAFSPAGRMVGFLFGFPGLVSADNPAAAGTGRWHHCSHMMGVIPKWRGRGVGHQLKLAQRRWAIDQGFDLVTWTFDPLEVANAGLNLGKLGAICRCYLRDFFGEMADALNMGLPTDRFEVAWWVESDHVRGRLAGARPRSQLSDLLDGGATILNPGRIAGDGRVEPGTVRSPEGRHLLIEIPTDIQAIKGQRPDLALAWRMSAREACEAAFAAGYTAIDVVRAELDDVPRSYYLLQHNFVIA